MTLTIPKFVLLGFEHAADEAGPLLTLLGTDSAALREALPESFEVEVSESAVQAITAAIERLTQAPFRTYYGVFTADELRESWLAVIGNAILAA